jgi:hypothetical protein
MSAPYAQTQLALDTHLAQFATARALTVRWENQTAFNPPQDEEWLWPTFMPAAAEVRTLSQRLTRLTGIYQINAFCPEETGSAALNQLVDELLDHFTVGSVLTSGTDKVKIIGNERTHGRPDGNGFFQIPAILRWAVWATT